MTSALSLETIGVDPVGLSQFLGHNLGSLDRKMHQFFRGRSD